MNDFDAGVARLVDKIERRAICRSCGRGVAAPHTDACPVGKARRAHDEFRLSEHCREISSEVAG